MKKLLLFLAVLFAIVFAFSLSMIAKTIIEQKKDVEFFEEIYNIATDVRVTEENNDTSQNIDEAKSDEYKSVNLSTLTEINPDCKGWIFIEDTPINYPVMYTPDEMNKYVHKNFYEEYSASGTPFIQDGCSLVCDNVIIHAHNMLNGTMFAGLKKYLDKEFFVSHPTVILQTEDGINEYDVWLLAQIKDDDLWYSFINESEEADFVFLTENLSKKAIFSSEKNPEFGDIFITLSTCYGRHDEDRLILVAIKNPT